ncbi:hypothetical protein Tfer_1784 [Thermincola ferriacetica]|uniref:Uncharacterized protein n=2 Tax=Thermincola TaxID=278993 RepID=D5XBC8_THEPJ|nr:MULTISPECIES: hypothetical protein [Thermincola]ADG83357.1 conserved hypothetical protein [Thermincola potens JR]KNZ69539.1 hypothetical protein Tfer_1784 [Thermincola ferriacetica]
MDCLECGNCRQGDRTYYCTARNDFVIKEENLVIERSKMNSGWKKGEPGYENRRRKTRKDRDDMRKIG